MIIHQMYNFLISWIVAFIFALFDVIGFRNASDISRYRKIQISVQILLIILTSIFFNWQISIGFLTLWWYWVCDLIYYFIYDSYAYIFNKPMGFKSEVLGNKVDWAYFTPFGLITKKKIIPGYILLIQAFIGITITFIITCFL